jgi:hypothetical protein
VWPGEGVEEAEPRSADGGLHDGKHRNIKCRHVNERNVTQ